MTDDLLEIDPESRKPLLLDPFGAHPHWASRIAGQGGREPAPDPCYVFATLDSRPGIGRVRATITFGDLRATRGTFLFEVRVRSAVRGADHSLLETLAVDAAALAAAGGIVELCFDSYRNAHYAIHCSINDETDVAASYIMVSIDRRATPAQHSREWDWLPADGVAARRRPGIEAALIHRSITDPETPSLALPMSQAGSPLQCREPAFAEAMRTLGRTPEATFENWSLAYVLQAIERFSNGLPCRMIGYGDDEAPLLSHFAGRACEVVGVRHMPDRDQPLDPGRELQRLWVPELCSEGDFFARAHFTAGDIRHPVESLQGQFDVLWSIGANRVLTQYDFMTFVVGGLIHVRPGGLAVHVFDYIEDVDAERGTSLNRHDIERIAALALSHHNDVVRLQFLHGTTLPDRRTPLPFGLVLLRGGALDG